MKIAFIGGRDIHKLGGIETYMMNLCSKLVELGHEPIVYCESDSNRTEMVNGFTVIHQKCIKSKFWCKPVLGYRAMSDVIKHYPDIKVLHFNAAGPCMLAWVARLKGKKTIYQGHGIEWRRTKWNAYQRFMIMMLDSLTQWLSSSYAIAVSQEQCKIISKWIKPCVNIPCAVNLTDVVQDSSILDRFSLQENNYYLYLGRLVQDKNPDFLIKAFIKSQPKSAKLVIAGSNDADPEYVMYLKSLAKDNKNVIFTGSVYGGDKETLLAKCKAFCIPSTIEGLAITLLEAMSYGKICIASDIQANIEGLGENGIWVKAEDIETLAAAIEKVENNYEKLLEDALKNRKRVETNFTWDIVAKRYMDFIESKT